MSLTVKMFKATPKRLARRARPATRYYDDLKAYALARYSTGI